MPLCPHRWSQVAAAVTVVAATAAPALAAQQTATDHLATVRFTLHGRLLRAEIAGGGESTAAAEQALKGRLIRATCGTAVVGGSGPPPSPAPSARARPSLADRRTYTRAIKRWPAHLQRTTFRLPRNLFAGARWCALEHLGAGDEITRADEIAFVDLRLGHNPAEDVASTD